LSRRDEKDRKKVVTEPRGIYACPIKKDKHPTSYFTNAFAYDEKLQKINEELEKKERDNYINLVKLKKTKEYKQDNKKSSFMPGSPKEYTDWFDFKEHKKRI